jgi:hypothetical protein
MKFNNEITIPRFNPHRSKRDTALNTRIPWELRKAMQKRAKQLGLKQTDWVVNVLVQALNNPTKIV